MQMLQYIQSKYGTESSDGTFAAGLCSGVYGSIEKFALALRRKISVTGKPISRWETKLKQAD